MTPAGLNRRQRTARRLVLTLLAVLSMVAASLVVPRATPVAEAAAGNTGDDYRISGYYGKCMEGAGWMYDYACAPKAAQAFRLEAVAIAPAGKYFRLVNKASGKCLDIWGASTASGAAAAESWCNGGRSQTFSRTPRKGGGYHLANYNSGMCLAPRAESTYYDEEIWDVVTEPGYYFQQPCDWSNPVQVIKMMRSYPAGTGAIPTHESRMFSLTDRAGGRVDMASGNLMLTSADFSGINRSWNSLSTDDTTELRHGWTLNLGRDTYLAADCSGTGPDASMPHLLKFKFTKRADGSYAEPTGMNVALTKTSAAGTACTAESWKVTNRYDRSSMSFAGPSAGRRYLTQLADVGGNKTTVNYYTAAGTVRTGSVTDHLGRSTTFTRTADGVQIAGARDWAQRSVSYTYDTAGRLVSATDLVGKVTRYGYDAKNLITSITDPNGNVTAIVYDGFRRVYSITRGGQRWAFGYDLENSGVCPATGGTPPANRSYVVPPNFKTFTYCWDDEGRVREMREDIGEFGHMSFDYDANSNVTKVGGLDSQASTGYDASSRLTSTTDAVGTRSSFGYADATNPYLATSVTDPQGKTSRASYDSGGRLTRVTDPAARAQSFTYNANGTLASATDQLGQVSGYGYDTSGRVTSINPPGTAIGTNTLGYDTLGRVSWETDGKGQRTTYSYDNLDRKTRVSYADGSFVGYGFDGNGNLASRQDANGITTYTYTALNQLKSTTAPGDGTVTYGYDTVGQLVSYTDSGGTTRYEYGVGQKLSKVIEPSGATTTYVNETAPGTSRSFHPEFPVKINYPNGVTVTNTPDLAGRLIATVAADYQTGTTLVNRGYSYRNPATGAMTDLIHTESDYVANTRTSNTYDAIDQLTRARTTNASTGALVSDYAYTYDAAGNRTSSTTNGTTVTETNDAARRVKSRGSTTYAYDANGNMTSSSAGFAATFNARNQTTSIKAPGKAAVTTSYAGEGQDELRQVGAKTLTNSAIGTTRVGGDRFTRGPDGRLVSMRTAEGETHYYLTDVLGSVVGMVGPREPGGTTNWESGGVDGGVGASFDPGMDGEVALTTFTYKGPMGMPGAANGSSAGAARNPFMFGSELYFADLRLYPIGPYWYDPELSRNIIAIMLVVALLTAAWFYLRTRTHHPGCAALGGSVPPFIFGSPIGTPADWLEELIKELPEEMQPWVKYVLNGFALGILGYITGGWGIAACEHFWPMPPPPPARPTPVPAHAPASSTTPSPAPSGAGSGDEAAGRAAAVAHAPVATSPASSGIAAGGVPAMPSAGPATAMGRAQVGRAMAHC